MQGGDHRVPKDFDFGMLQGALGEDRSGPQFIPTVDDRDFGGKSGQKQGIFHGGIATTDDGDLFVAIEKAITGGANRDPSAVEFLFVGQAEHAGRGAGTD